MRRYDGRPLGTKSIYVSQYAPKIRSGAARMASRRSEKGTNALAGSLQVDRAHGRCIEETCFTVDFENGKQVGWFAGEGEMPNRSQRNYDAHRQNADMGALHVEPVRCKFARLNVRVRVQIKPDHQNVLHFVWPAPAPRDAG